MRIALALALMLWPLGLGPALAAGKQTFTVAVLGDGFGDALAEGLRANFAGEPDVIVLNKTHAPYGLSDEPSFDWSVAVQNLFAPSVSVSAVVVMMGANDVKPLRDGAVTVAPGSSRWNELYGNRVQAVAAAIRAKGVPVTWVGLPIVGDDEAATNFSALNEVLRDRALKGGASFVDSWDAFVNEDGKYSQFGPDVNGRVVRLRAADGFDLTRAGSRKLASFVEPDLRGDRERITAVPAVPPPVASGLVIPDQPEALNVDITAQIRREAGLEAQPSEGARPPAQAGPVVALTAPPVSAEGRLIQRTGSGPGDIGGTLANRVLVQGLPVQPRSGRADDFTWPRP